MKNLSLSIIIVSYNTREFLINCLVSIAQSKNCGSFEVIIVDNASSDDSVICARDFAKKESLAIKIIDSPKNLGFSKANNLGIKQSEGKYLLFLNPDTVVQKDALWGMVEFMNRHEQAGAATCRVNLINGQIDDASHRGFPTPWRSFCYFSGISKIFPYSVFFNGYNLGWKDLDKIHQIESCCGAFMIVARKVGDSLGWWDEDFFWYGEDLDFCFRIIKKGFKIYYVPQFKILHYKGVSSGIKKISKDISTAKSEVKIMATKARFDAMKLFYKKHYEKIYPRLFTFFIIKGINIKRSSALKQYVDSAR